MTSPIRQITVISGDGIGQEVVDATLHILEAASAPLTWVKCRAGDALFKEGISPKTFISLILCLILISIQVLWKTK